MLFRSTLEKYKADIVAFNDIINECTKRVIELNSEISHQTGVFSGLKRSKLIKEQNTKKNEIALMEKKISETQKEINWYNNRFKNTLEQLKMLTGEELKNLIDKRINSIQSSIRYNMSELNSVKTSTPYNYTLSLDSIDKFRNSIDYILVPHIDVSDM